MTGMLFVLALTVAGFWAGDAAAQEAPVLHYQGVLTDLADRPLSRATPMSFRLYTEPEGGNPTWEELHGSVDVVDGVFTVALGSIKPLTAAMLGEIATYLEVAVDGEALTPRQRLGAVGRALLADQARDVAGRDIHPRSVSIEGVGEVIDAEGKWVGTGGGGGAGGGGGGGAEGGVGTQGAQGVQGLQGPPGPAGNAGAQGAAGASGPAGVQGAVGPQGPAGSQGPVGALGPAGASGQRGPDGFPGERGSQGEQGAPGALGQDGEDGEDGAPGQPGEPGPGIVIDEDTDLDGFPDWLEVALGTDPDLDDDFPEDLDEDGIPDAMQGPVGRPGERGIQGIAGRDGIDGATTPLSNLFDERSEWPEESLDVPRADVDGIEAFIDVAFEGALTDLSISVDITHPDISRLEVTLRSPAGTTLTLHTGGEGADIDGTYGEDLLPVDDLEPLLGEPVVGRWTLIMADTTLGNAAAPRRLNSWSVNLTRRADNAWRLPGDLVVEGSVLAETLCSIAPLSVNGNEVPGVIVLTCGEQPPIRLSTFQCGNEAIDPGETCDDGNFLDDDGCDQRCLLECGNGRIDGEEQCDDGNIVGNDACTDTCQRARCGDAIIQIGAEECDDGDDANSDEDANACRTDCLDAACGDGVVDDGEDCDDGNGDDWDGCSDDCRARDGQTPDSAGISCKLILDLDAEAENGTYWLDFDAGLPNVPREAHCDMANGGWTYESEGEPFKVDFSGSTQTLKTVGAEAEYWFTLFGASGGEGVNQDGGEGGVSEGSKSFAANTTLYVEVGGVGLDGGTEDQGDANTRTGGYNGGGRGTRGGSGGGGGTDIRTADNDLASRLIVAGGGGGCGNGSCATRGGNGGGLNGEAQHGGGGTQAAGGSPGGALGRGGDNVQENDEGGGGGGYYGGGAGGAANRAAGGGSSYYDGMDANQATTTGSNRGHGYAEYIFQ